MSVCVYGLMSFCFSNSDACCHVMHVCSCVSIGGTSLFVLRVSDVMFLFYVCVCKCVCVMCEHLMCLCICVSVCIFCFPMHVSVRALICV